jgi:hypothetical protein
MTREFIGLAPNHTEIAEDVIQEERERRLAERVSRRIANIEQNIEMFKQLPSRIGASSSSSGMTGYIAGVPALVGGAGQAARAVAGAVGYLKPGAVVGTIAGGTIAAAAIGGIETGRGIYHTGATAGGILLDYYLGGDGEEPQSAGSNPEPSMRKKKKYLLHRPRKDHLNQQGVDADCFLYYQEKKMQEANRRDQQDQEKIINNNLSSIYAYRSF